MQLVKIVFERIPLVWFLLGLLFFATGLYLGIDYAMSLVYLLVGAFCCCYGIVLFLFRLRERPRSSAARTLSPNFISAGSTVVMPASMGADKESEHTRSA